MAKNSGRRANVEAKQAAKQEEKNKEQLKKQQEKALQESSGSGKKKDVLYQVKTRRDSDVIKAYITFTYRVLHPGVTGRLIFIGILIGAPSIIAKQTWLKAALLIIGVLLILLGLFRQYISLAITKSKDEAYKNGTEFTYDFTQSGASLYADGKMISTLNKYKDIISFYYDDDYFYLGTKNKDFFILPKSRFTIGDSAEFEDFIYKKSRKTCRWIPTKYSDRIKQRRAARQLGSSQSRINR